MAYFLAKTDPETYSIDDLERETTTTWDGVRNAQALIVIKTMRPGDTLVIYHSMGHAAMVGLAEVVSEPRPDPNAEKSWVVDVRFVKRLDTPITLREVKETGRFDEWALVRQSRLSTMPIPDDVVAWLRESGAL